MNDHNSMVFLRGTGKFVMLIASPMVFLSFSSDANAAIAIVSCCTFLAGLILYGITKIVLALEK